MKYAEIDCTKKPDAAHPNGYLYYPFAEHDHFCFWMVDRIRRHRALAQCSVFLKQNPEEAALSMEELKAMAANGQLNSVFGKMYSYTANVTGSDAYWNKRRRELEAIMQQKGLGTAFFTVSFADNHWHDLHRFMPNGLAEPKLQHHRTNANPHLADWYFSEKLRLFMKHFLVVSWISNGCGTALSGNQEQPFMPTALSSSKTILGLPTWSPKFTLAE